MLFCKDCRIRATHESAICKQKEGESVNDFYERILKQFNIKDRFLFGLSLKNIDMVLKIDIEMPLNNLVKLLSEKEVR